jgi:hypothetical protein
MTPKEKAEELYEAYFYCIPSFTDEGSIEHNTAKKCALIAVDEVLGYMGADRGYIFWQEVKQELEKL